MDHSRQKCERGYAIILLTGVIALLLVGGTLGLNAVTYYHKKASLLATAKSVAEYGGAFLPNPEVALEQSWKHWQLLSKRFVHPSLDPSLAPTIAFYLTSAAGDKVPYDGVDGLVDSPPPFSELLDSTNIALPIKSLTVRITSTFSLSLLNFASINNVFTVSAEATSQLTATDIALVIESSNSLISVMESELTSPGSVATGPFGTTADWSTKFYPIYACRGCPVAVSSSCGPFCAKKDVRYTRECFGKVAMDIKRAAVTLYDLLSSSGTYRVSVVHATSGGNEFGHLSVPLGTHPYYRYDTDGDFTNSTNSNYDPDLFLSVNPNLTKSSSAELKEYPALEEVEGISDHAATRCARLTADTLRYGVPSHPFESQFKGEHTKLLAHDLTVDPKTGATVMPAPSGDPLLSHLMFRGSSSTYYPAPRFAGTERTTHLLPREIIWMKNSGYTHHSGMPINRHTYNPIQMGIMRAIDTLYHAPPRADNIPVNRKIILVLTDGFETSNDSNDDWLFNSVNRFSHIFSEPSLALANANPQTTVASAPFSATLGNINSSPCESPDFVFGGLSGYPAFQGSSPYNIDSATSVPAVIKTGSGVGSTTVATPGQVVSGYKLGILRYGFSDDSGMYGEPSLKSISYHDEQNATVARTQCQSGWATRRGRFWGEASPTHGETQLSATTSADLNTKDGYWALLAPMVARTIFMAELTD